MRSVVNICGLALRCSLQWHGSCLCDWSEQRFRACGWTTQLNKVRSTLSDSHRLCSFTISDIGFQTMQFSALKFVVAIVVAVSFTGFTQAAVNVLVLIQSLLYSLISRVVRSPWVFLYAFNRGSAHWYVVSYAGSKCFCTHWILAMLIGMSCRMQHVSVVCTHSIVVMLTAMSCRTQDVSVLVSILLRCPLLCRATCSWWVFLYAFNRRYAHCYVLSYAGRECSCMHWILAMLTPMSCRTQKVSVLVHIESLLCSLLCCVVRRKWVLLYACNGYSAHHYVVSYAGRECLCTRSIVALLTAMSCRTQEVSVLVRIQSLLCSLLCRVVRRK